MVEAIEQVAAYQNVGLLLLVIIVTCVIVCEHTRN